MELKWNKYLSYYLGFLYSDGSVDKYRAIIEIVKDDGDVIEPFIKKSGLDFLIYTRNRKNRRQQKSFYHCDVLFSKYLYELNFNNKSTESPITTDIPEDLFRYFILGIIDGDGCFYISNDKITKQFYITSSYNYDWVMIESLFNTLNIKYKISRVINSKEKNHRSSYIRVTKYDSLRKIHEYLYPSGYEIGLKRKYDKSIDMIKNKPMIEHNTEPLILDDIKHYLETMNYMEIGEKLNCSDRKVRRFSKKNKIGTYSEE